MGVSVGVVMGGGRGDGISWGRGGEAALEMELEI